MTSIPQNALGLSIFVLFYSGSCCAFSILLVCMLWRYGERASYVALISVFVTLSTTESIIQQIFYAVDWSNVKEVEFQQAQHLKSEPGRAYSTLGPPVQVICYWIQFYCYDVLSLLILSWTISLYHASYNISFNLRVSTEEKVSVASKIFAALLPIILIVTVNSKAVFSVPILWLILDYMIIATSLTAGFVLLILVLVKYIRTRKLTTRHMRQRSGWWQPGSEFSQQGSNSLESGPDFGTSSSNSGRTSIYDQALITRFSIAFVLLALFEVVTATFQISQKNNNDLLSTLPGPDLSLTRAQVDLVGFIPGVTASLVAFAVFGTTRSFDQYKRLLMCAPQNRSNHTSRRILIRTESHQRVLPSPMLPSPQTVSPMTISPMNSPLPSPRNWDQDGTELSLAPLPPPTNISPSRKPPLYPLQHLSIRFEDSQTGSQNARNPS